MFNKTITAMATMLLVTTLPMTQVNARPKSIEEKRWIPGQIIVKPKAGVSNKKFEKMLRKMGVSTKSRFQQLNVHVVTVSPQAEDALMQAMSDIPDIDYCVKDMLIEPSAILPNDPEYSRQWYLPKMEVPTAWETSSGEGVTVAILDTGIEADHPDLLGNLVPGWNSVSDNDDTSPAHWHGTAVAGVVGATSNNLTGVASVATRASIMPIRVSNSADGSSSLSALINGILWAADHGADVINISYGIVGSEYIFNDAAQYFRSKGGVIVYSAGNEGEDGGYSDNPYLISVAATTSGDNRASFSNYGNYIDVSAPGANIYTTYTNGRYRSTSGTSFSSPAVAGVVALIMATNPYLTPEEVEAVLEQSADDLIEGADWHPYFGHGRVNAAAAVLLAQQGADLDAQAPNVTIFSPQNNVTVSGDVMVEINATDNVGVSGVDLYADGQLVGRDTTAPYQFNWDSMQFADGDVMFIAYAQDSAGNEGSSNSLSVVVKNQPDEQDNTPPVVSIFDPEEGIAVSRRVIIQATSSDNVAISKLALFIDGSRYRTTSANTMRVSWWLTDVSNGAHVISVIAEDTSGNTAESSVTVWKQE